MSALDDLRALFSGAKPEEEEDPLEKMVQTTPPPVSAGMMSSEPPMQEQMDAPAGQNLGHPEVLSYLKELDQKGAFKPQGAEAPRGMMAAQTTVQSEVGGVPADVRAEGVAVRGQEQLDNAAVDRDRMNAQAAEMERQAAALRAQAQVENEQRQQAEAENAEKQARLRAQQMELSGQNDEPINPNRYFQNMSVFSKATAIISAGIHGYLGKQGQAPVIETLTQMAKQDVDAQMADNKASAGRRNSLIDQYERQYGDTSLVAKRLEADKLLTMSKEAQAKSLDARTVESKAAAEDLTKKLQNRVGTLHREIQEATYGKPATSSTTFARPKPTGPADSGAAIKKALELDKVLEERGFTKAQREATLKAQGVALPGGESATTQDRALKLAEIEEKKQGRDQDQGKALAAWRTIQDLGTEAGLGREKDGSFTVPTDIGSRVNISELGEKIDGAVGGATPIANARKVAIEALGRLESGGAIGEEEGKTFAEMLGHASSPRQIADVLNRIQIVVEPRMKVRDFEAEDKKAKGAPKRVSGRVPT